MANNFCYHCGEPVTGFDTKVCSSCGRPLQTEQTESSSYENYQSRDYYEAPRAQPGVAVANQSLVLATVLSASLPGMGQVYNGKVGKGLLFVVCFWVGLVLIIPGLIVWIYAMWDAYTEAGKINTGEVPFENPSFLGILSLFVLHSMFYLILVAITMLSQYLP